MLFDSPCGLKRLFIPASTLIQVRRFTLRKIEGGASGSARELGPVRLRSTEQPPENHGARIALCLNTRYRTESFAFFTVRVGVTQKTGLQIDLKAHLLSLGNFLASLFYGEDDPETLTLNYVNASYKRPARSKEVDNAIWYKHARRDNHTLRCVWYRPEGRTSSIGR